VAGAGGTPQSGQQQQQGATPQAALPSPLYPWMRSQFGKAKMQGSYRRRIDRKLYTVKKVIDFPVRNREVTIAKLSLAGNNLIIPGQGEFG
jgi:hypothetical protein